MDSHLQKLQHAIADTTQGMTPEDLNRHPEGKWCAAEVLEHLYLTYTGSVRGLERCLQLGKPLARSPRFRDHVARSLVVGLGYLPGGRAAPETTIPRGLAPDTVIDGIQSQVANMEKLFTECEARYGVSARLLDHPSLGPLTGRQWRKFHWVHGWHHLKQIKELRS